jgi:hypothetical protein
MSKDREKELLQKLAERRSQETMQLVCELLRLRLARYSDSLVSVGDDVKRGRAQEARELIKHLDKQVQ